MTGAQRRPWVSRPGVAVVVAPRARPCGCGSVAGLLCCFDGGRVRDPYLFLLVYVEGEINGILGAGCVYQLGQDPSWSLVPTCFGGFLSLRVVSSSGESGWLLVLGASDPLSPGDVMAGGHLQPGRSASLVHVDVIGVLLMEAFKNSEVSSSGWSSASSCKLDVFPLNLLVRWELVGWLPRMPMTKTTGKTLQGLSYNFPFFQGCLCKE